MNTVGILALQGDFTRHQEALDTLGVAHTLIYKPEALAHCDRLIIPGGESSTLLKLMEHTTFFTEIKAFAAAQKPILGTCAGLILLAKNVSPNQASLGLLDITVARNAYGRQLESFSDFGTFGKTPR